MGGIDRKGGRVEPTSESTDRRVRRTKELLRSALLSLILEKGYDKVTVQDLLDRADVGRSTFYAHYRDKDELLMSGFEEVRAALAEERDAAETGRKGSSEFLEPLVALFRHVDGHRHLWTAMARKGGVDMVIRILSDSATDLVRTHLRLQLGEADVDPVRFDAAVQFVVGAFMALLIWWVESDVPYSPEEIHSAFRRMAAPGVRRFLTREARAGSAERPT